VQEQEAGQVRTMVSTESPCTLAPLLGPWTVSCNVSCNTACACTCQHKGCQSGVLLLAYASIGIHMLPWPHACVLHPHLLSPVQSLLCLQIKRLQADNPMHVADVHPQQDAKGQEGYEEMQEGQVRIIACLLGVVCTESSAGMLADEVGAVFLTCVLQHGLHLHMPAQARAWSPSVCCPASLNSALYMCCIASV
jgi:hypothetical protein